MESHKRGLPVNYVKNTSTVKLQMCFFIVYLLKIITSIIKANTIIVSTTPNKSKYISSNKTASIIAPPPFS